MRPRQLWLLLLLLACSVHPVGAFPRLCDVLQVLWAEQDQCLQDLSREWTDDLGLEQPTPGSRWPQVAIKDARGAWRHAPHPPVGPASPRANYAHFHRGIPEVLTTEGPKQLPSLQSPPIPYLLKSASPSPTQDLKLTRIPRRPESWVSPCPCHSSQRKLGQDIRSTAGCKGLWDNMSCWPSAEPGWTVEVGCPRFLQMLTGRNGSMFRNCTRGGWSETFPTPDVACGINVNNLSNEKRHAYLLKLKVMYTVGYSSSLVMLLVALSILCAFRRLHCTRNYIHMHLFVSFILRALSNFIKDAVLFSDDAAHCDAPRVGCKLVMVFFQYCIVANYTWLLVEGLYLHALLVISFFSERKCLQGFVALGWGSPAIFVTSWAITRHFLEDVGCWDINANASIWWVIRGPVIVSILMNFILFINILRILMTKLRTQETRGNAGHHYKRLAKSTLLLIPLFGVHYMVFVFSPEDAMEIQLFFELALGSFQGLVVAVLYCFLNGEVQLEVQKKWQQWHLRELPMRPVALSSSFGTGTSGLTHGTKASPSEQSRGTCRASVI